MLRLDIKPINSHKVLYSILNYTIFSKHNIYFSSYRHTINVSFTFFF